MLKHIGNAIGWVVAAIVVAVMFILMHTLGFMAAAARAAGEYAWLAKGFGTSENSPFGWLREREQSAEPDDAEGEEDPEQLPETDEATPQPVLRSIQGGRSKVVSKPVKVQKQLKKNGCAVEPGWSIEEVNQEEGHRVELNDHTGTRRLVHMGSGQVIVPDLATVPAAPVQA